MARRPTRSEIEATQSEHLTNAAKVWDGQAGQLAAAFERAQRALDELPWDGAAAAQARARLRADLAKIGAALDLFRRGAEAARTGAQSIDAAKRSAVSAIDDAERQLFSVSEDLKVTDRIPPALLGLFGWLRTLQARALETEIGGLAQALADADERVANELQPIAAQLREFTLDGTGTAPTGPPGTQDGPVIVGPAGPLQFEQDDYDLEVAWPDGQGPTLGGDPQTHDADGNPLGTPVPRDPDSERANDPNQPGTRPIPTGTAIGPNGERYAFFSYPDGTEQDGVNPYATEAQVWDYSDPNHPVQVTTGPLTSGDQTIYQPSGAYDSSTGRMVVVGNTGNGTNDTTRILYQSDPIKPGDPPNKWTQTLRPVGEVQGLPGARENQLVALKGGGFALVGSDNYSGDPNHPRPAVSAVTASTAQGLTTAAPTVLVEPTTQSGYPAAPYGPTVVGTTYDPLTGQETLQLRVSTWDGVVMDGRPYDPKTYTTDFTIQH